MKLTVMYWNLWFKNQVKGEVRAEHFLQGFEEIILKYKPDCIGLNEVLQHAKASTPYIFEFLKQHGYQHSYFAPASPIVQDWTIGAGLVSKYPLQSVCEIVLSEDVPAKKRGFDNHTVKAITAEIVLPNDTTINMIVVHPLYVRPTTWRAHYEAIQKLQSLFEAEKYSHKTIIGGDFNESIHWPKSFYRAMRSKLNHRTGTILNPTWLHNALPWTPIRVNLDQLYWTKDDITLRSFEVVKSNLSDHRPLVAVFEIRSTT